MMDYGFLFLISFLTTVLFTYFIKKILIKSNIVDNPIVSEHRHKTGTPTMGGIAFLFSILFVSSIYYNEPLIIVSTLTMIVAGIFGLLDDLIGLKSKEIQKVIKNISEKSVKIGILNLKPNHEARVATLKAKRDLPSLLDKKLVKVIDEVPIKNEISERDKIIIQMVIGTFLIVTSSILTLGGYSLGPLINFGGILVGILSIPVILIGITGAINAVNLIDGMDGLSSGIIAIASSASVIYLFITGNLDKSPPFIVLIGLTLGFLVFNRYPASIFMGDAGSFVLGAGYGTAVLITDIPYFGVLTLIVPIATVVISLLHRVHLINLPIEPFHHVLNYHGISEKKIIALYWLITLIISIVGLLTTYYFFL
ncbi:MAG: phospho-N-acetylmuramoyl-pentapeptide-transferase [Methanobrevibacter sp.]|nr:phospho-N-acetylmuramoyl-pentapeptide-transferase [Candidatus Methanovirga aequatorialis]